MCAAIPTICLAPIVKTTFLGKEGWDFEAEAALEEMLNDSVSR
jgi:hypothetical protein